MNIFENINDDNSITVLQSGLHATVMVRYICSPSSQHVPQSTAEFSSFINCTSYCPQRYCSGRKSAM